MRKRFVSILLVLSIVMSVSIPRVFAVDESAELFTANIDDQEITFNMYEIANKRYVDYWESGEHHEVVYNMSSGQITHDGVLVMKINQTTVSTQVPINNAREQTSRSFTWVHYDTTYGDIVGDVLTVAGWTSVLFGFFGVATPDVVALAELLAAACLPTVYYICYHYYKSPVTTSRPQTGKVYDFYRDEEYNRFMKTIDLRSTV